MNTHQTTVESRSWLFALSGARTGSPRSRFARIPPEKITKHKDN